jgi:serine/threonine-protein phosphatase 2A regulatory subunit B'
MMLLTLLRTIHGMVYNAMKLFMEVNPQLFDDCSHDYAEQQNHASEKLLSRQARWDKLSELAAARQNGRVQPPLPTTTGQGSKVITPLKVDEGDPLSQESQRRLEGLKLQDDGTKRERRPSDYSGNSVR